MCVEFEVGYNLVIIDCEVLIVDQITINSYIKFMKTWAKVSLIFNKKSLLKKKNRSKDSKYHRFYSW